MTDFPWTPAIKATVVDRFIAGESCSEIARDIGLPDILVRPSRNAVIGLLHRMGASNRERRVTYPASANRTKGYTPKSLLPKPAKPPAPPKPVKVAKAPKPAPEPKVAKPRLVICGNNQVIEPGPDRPPIVAPPRADAFKALPGSTPLNIMQLPSSMACKWPIDTDDGILSCCLPTGDRDAVYCLVHALLAYAAQKPKHRTGHELARSLRRFI